MMRERATQLLKELIENAARDDWPNELVQAVHVFGSYSRGAMEPHDVDVAVDIDRSDERWVSHFIHCMSYGRDPRALLRKALRGRTRSIEILFEPHEGHDDVPMTLLWQRGESLDLAYARLDAIPIDASAGRAPRDAMLPCFEGLEHWLPRDVRQELVALVSDGAITVEQITLADAEPTDPWIRDYIDSRWSVSSPLRRAANAALAHLEFLGVDLYAVHLHGSDISKPVTPHFVGFRQRYFPALLSCLTERGGVQWLEVAHPTGRSPLRTLLVRPIDRSKIVDTYTGRSGFYFFT